MKSAQRVSTDTSDNFVFQRSLLAYHVAAARAAGNEVLEIGTGTGYGIDIIKPRCPRFVTCDKSASHPEAMRMRVPPLDFPAASFDCVVSFQVIEHIRRDRELIREIHRVLRPGGKLILSTPNASMSLTRNPWHVREYTPEGLQELLKTCFPKVEMYGVTGNERVAAYYERNRAAVRRVERIDILQMRKWLPRWAMRGVYDMLNRINRKNLDSPEARAIAMDDYAVNPLTDTSIENCFDLFAVAQK